MIRISVLLSSLLISNAALAATIRIDDCSSGGTCTTLTDAIAASMPGDTIRMAAGTYSYSSMVEINKSLTVRGERGTVINAANGFVINANNVTLTGLTIQNGNQAVQILPTSRGTVLSRNTLTNNGTAINLGGDNTTIINNVISNNNNGDPSAVGYGIYTDENAGGQMRNLVISNNTFTGNQSTDIGINVRDPAQAMTGLTISNNTFTKGGRAMYLINVHGVRITGNTIQGLGAPLGGKDSMAIGLWGGIKNAVVTGNTLKDGQKYGISIMVIDPEAGTNSNLVITRNRITGYATYGLYAQAPSPGLNATCNWWGSASGPSNADFNSNGTGDAVYGAVKQRTVSPWLKTSNLAGECAAAPMPPAGFAGTWENRASKSCIRISSDETQARSYRKCGPFNCDVERGSFVAILNTDKATNVDAYGYINYNDPRESDQRLELINSRTMLVSNIEVATPKDGAGVVYKKVTSCNWHPRWPFPPHRPKPEPTPPQPQPTPSNT